MKNFISIIIDNDGINESRDFVLDTVLNTANIGLLENTMEYEIYESENNTQVLSIPIARELNEKQQTYLAKKLANKMFDKGYNNFDIEFSLSEATLNEAAPTTFTPTHYGGPGGLNNVMLHTDGNLYFQKQRDDGQPGREIVRWNGNPTGEGFFGRWNPATIKGTIVNGQRVPYPAGTNFSNAPRAAAPAAAAPAAAPAASTTPTGGLLRRGNRGEEVKQLQRDLGMTGDEIDGIFGPATERAVRTFQQTSGSQVDGIVGPETRAAIEKYQGNDDDNTATSAAPTTSPRPRARPDADADGRTDAEIDAGAGTDAAPTTSPRPRARPGADTDGRTAAEIDAGAGQGATTAPDPDANDPRGRDQRNTPPRAGQADATAPDPDTTNADAMAAGQQGAADATAPETIEVTSDDQANSIFQDPNATDAERQAAREWYGASDQSLKQYSDIGAAMLDRDNVELGDKVTIDDKEATVVTTDDEQKYFVDSNAQPIGEVPSAQTSVVQPDEPVGTDAAPTIDTTDDPEVNTTSPGGLGSPDGADAAPNISDNPANRDAQRVAAELEAWQEKYGSSTVGAYGLPAEYGQMLDAALDLTPDSAQKLKDESVGAPQAVAVVVLGELRRAYDIDPDADVFRELMNLRREVDNEEPDQAAALTTLAQLARDLQKTANPEQSNESVEPMPKGAFMVEDRAIWRSLYESTHYTNGKPRPRTFISESKRTIPEITFEDDDKFFENYGVMWFNEDDVIDEAEYQGRKVKLGKPMAGDVKKFKVYVKNPKGNVVKVNFGQKGAKIKKNNPERRRSFRARHNCDNPGPRHKARYWSCRKW